MECILIPVTAILRNPLAERKSDRLLEINGWIRCLVRPVPTNRKEGNDVQLIVALSLKRPDAAASMGRIWGFSNDNMNATGRGTATLEKEYAVHGRPEGTALSLAIRICAHHVDVSHLRLVAHKARASQ